ncbi:otoferlin-like [Tubulanus polymorphus]|uniref:otoferlin-like n=1 Tax=Tubulanus polymorphus TaxID=672921 RepID=UPI003DA4D649
MRICKCVFNGYQTEGGFLHTLATSRSVPKWLDVSKLISRKTPRQYFVFDFKMTKAQLFDQVINITAIATGRSIPGIRRGQKIGVFKMDVGTVYTAPDHMFPNKWAVLMDPDDVAAGPRGYLKCTIMVIGKGEPVKSVPKQLGADDLDDIEENLLLPTGMAKERQMAELEIKIHKAEDLPQMTTDVMAGVRKAFFGGSRALIDPFVQVSFAGHTAKTKVKKKTYKPEWNEKFTFREVFPPLCNRIKIQILDDDTVKNDIVATTFLPLNEISNSGEYGFMPMFGPSWLNFYGAPRGTTLTNKEKELNCGLGEGAAYRGRLLMSIKTQLTDDNEALSTGVEISDASELSENICGIKEDFILFGALFDASMIDKSIVDLGKPIHFEISIGNFGNTLDSTSWGYDESVEEDDPNQPELEAPSVSTTPPMFATSKDNISYYLPISGVKPCMYVTSWYEDCRKRLYNQNCLDDISDSLTEAINETRDLMTKEVPNAYLRLRKGLRAMIIDTNTYLPLLAGSGNAARTKLDKARRKICRQQMDQLKQTANKIRKALNAENLATKLPEVKKLLQKIKHLSRDPQHALADVYLWMIVGTKRMAYVRIPAKNIIHALSEEEMGNDCGVIKTVYLRQPGKKGIGQSSWSIQAKLQIYLWLGMDKSGKKLYLSDLPAGYTITEEQQQSQLPPTSIIYSDTLLFNLQAYMFLGRNVIGSDDSGLSDPFARVIIYDRCAYTKVLHCTLSPQWNQQLSINGIEINFSEDVVRNDPPTVIVECYDWDLMGDPEFLGRSIIIPNVVMLNDEYQLPTLEWWDIYRGQLKAGELLSAFELIQTDSSGQLPPGCPPTSDVPAVQASASMKTSAEKSPVIPIPDSIKPPVCKYRIEFVFWGVRELAKLYLLSVDRPRIDIECAGTLLSSTVIENASVHPNFKEPLKYMDVLLPENDLYWPPIMIRCVACRSFGRQITAGIHVISYIQKFDADRIIEDDMTVEKEPDFRFATQINTASPTFQQTVDNPMAEGVTNPMFNDNELLAELTTVDERHSTVSGTRSHHSVASARSNRSNRLKTDEEIQPSDSISQLGADDYQPSAAPSIHLSQFGSMEGTERVDLAEFDDHPFIAGDGDTVVTATRRPPPSDRVSALRGSAPGSRPVSAVGSMQRYPVDTVSVQAGDSASQVGSVYHSQVGSHHPLSQFGSVHGSVAGSQPGSRPHSPTGGSLHPSQYGDRASLLVGSSSLRRQSILKNASSRVNDSSSHVASRTGTIGGAAPSARSSSQTPRAGSLVPSIVSLHAPSASLRAPSASLQTASADVADFEVGEDFPFLPTACSTFISQSGTKPQSHVGSRAGSTVGSKVGSRPASQVGSVPGTKAGSRPGSVAGSRAGSVAGSRAGSVAGSKIGSRVGSKAPSKLGSKLGSRRTSLRSTKSQDKVSLVNGHPATDQSGFLVPQTTPTAAEGDVVVQMDETAPVSPAGTMPPPNVDQAVASPWTLRPSYLAKLYKLEEPPEIEELDWWSKYYVTLDDITEGAEAENGIYGNCKKKDTGNVGTSDSEDSDSLIDEFTMEGGMAMIASQRRGSQSSGDSTMTAGSIKSDDNNNKKKKKKKKEKKKKDKKKKKLRFNLKDIKKGLGKVTEKLEEIGESDSLVLEDDTPKDDKAAIERIKYFPCELEEVPAFNHFEDWLRIFPLLRGKKTDDDEDEDERNVGVFKGAICLYRIGEEDEEIPEPKMSELRLYKNLPSNDLINVMIRLYIIRANDLHPADLNGKADPFLMIRLGKQVINDSENYVSKQLNPVFGRCFQMEANFPMESKLNIQVYDWDLAGSNDLIGETDIDIENRFYTNHRARCGVSRKYETFGYNMWRDPLKPTQILTKLCEEHGLEPPTYKPHIVKVGPKFFTGPIEVKDENGELKPSNEPLALEALKNWHLMPRPIGRMLVPEHIECRPLFNEEEKPGVEQGKIELWIDMFPKDSPPSSAPLDITPRKPKSYELRVIVWNTDEVELNDSSFLTGEKSSDIFVKSFLIGQGDDEQMTDIHYNSFTGEGNFNWRFVYPFDFLKCEDKIVVKKKESLFSIDETEYKVPAVLNMTVWDADLISSDDFIGGLQLPLTKIPRAAKTARACKTDMVAPGSKTPLVSIFRNKHMKGWWPFVAPDSETGELDLKGKVEMELHLLTAEEAEKAPVGLARAEPEPLAAPNRPKTSFFSFLNPWNVFKHLIWGPYKWLIIKILCLLILIAFLVLILYNMPGQMTRKLADLFG